MTERHRRVAALALTPSDLTILSGLSLWHAHESQGMDGCQSSHSGPAPLYRRYGAFQQILGLGATAARVHPHLPRQPDHQPTYSFSWLAPRCITGQRRLAVRSGCLGRGFLKGPIAAVYFRSARSENSLGLASGPKALSMRGPADLTAPHEARPLAYPKARMLPSNRLIAVVRREEEKHLARSPWRHAREGDSCCRSGAALCWPFRLGSLRCGRGMT